MKKLTTFASFLVFIILLLSTPKIVFAQGYVYCSTDTFGTCQPDYSQGSDLNEFVECDPGYDPPSCSDPNNPQTCCADQTPTGSCNNVQCVSAGAVEPCDPDQTCSGLDPAQCNAAGGDPRDCALPLGTPDCCIDQSAPPSNCGPDSICQYVGGGASTCQYNAGVPQSCSSASEPNGNCCLPAGGSYFCAGNGVDPCVNDLTTGLNTCQNNFGPCQPGDPDCTSCDELSPSSCDPYSSSAFPCVEQNPTIGYRCAGSSFGCQPCFDFNADPNSPSYDPACDPPPFSTIADCDPTGSGTCTIPVPHIGQEIFCDANGNPTADPSSGELYTAIGCIPVENQYEMVAFFLRLTIGVAGGFAFLLIVVSGFQIITSSGDPQRLEAGKELLTSAVAGLLLLVFGVFILRLIGVNIFSIF